MAKAINRWLTAWRKPEFFLRLGLGAVYAYSSWHLLHGHKSDWAEIQGWIEAVLAIALLIPFWPRRLVKWGSLVAAIELVIVFKVVGITPDSFPLVGVIAAALALFTIYERHPRGL